MKKVGLVLRDRVVDAYAVPSLGGLVVHRSLYGRGLWMATHLPSKCSLGATGDPTRKGLVARLEKAQSFHPVDWSKSYDEMDTNVEGMLAKFWRTFNSTRATENLMSDDSWRKHFKCRCCGEKRVESMADENDVSICIHCTGVEDDRAIKEQCDFEERMYANNGGE